MGIVTPDVFREVTDAIVEAVSPEKIILFGSQARGEAGPGSDIDLVVIGQPKAKGRVASTMERLGLNDIVTTISGVSDEQLARLYGEAEVAIVPPP